MKESNNLSFALILVFLLCLPLIHIFGQELSNTTERRGDLRLLFYNCENLFDIEDDPEKRDNEFLPGGDKRWDYNRYRKKLNNIYKVIIAVGEWSPPRDSGIV